LIHDSWRAKGEEQDEEEVKTFECVKSGEDWTHWTHCDVWAKVVKDDAPSARELGFSQDFEFLVAQCLIKEEVSFVLLSLSLLPLIVCCCRVS